VIDDHELAAVRTAVALNERFASLAQDWRRRGYELGLGIGIATGYATLGRVGFESRYEYGAIGNSVILAQRLSDAAAPGEILVSQRTHAAVDEHFPSEPVPDLELKGFSRPVVAMRLAAGVREPR
jgi:class 3 adenylate cyclase